MLSLSAIMSDIKEDRISEVKFYEVEFQANKDQEIIEILLCLENNTSVDRLDLSGFTLSQEIISALCKLLTKKRNFSLLDLANTELTDEILNTLWIGLEDNVSLVIIDIEGNEITCEQKEKVKQLLSKHEKELELQHRKELEDSYVHESDKYVICGNIKFLNGHIVSITFDYDGRVKFFKKGQTWDNIPKFAVITGVNETGKSQLLEYIHKSARCLSQEIYKAILYIPPSIEIASLSSSNSRDTSSCFGDAQVITAVRDYFEKNMQTDNDFAKFLIKRIEENIKLGIILIEQAKDEKYIFEESHRTIDYEANPLQLEDPISFLVSIFYQFDRRKKATLEDLQHIKYLNAAYDNYRNITEKVNQLELRAFIEKLTYDKEFQISILSRLAEKMLNPSPMEEMHRILEHYGFKYKISFKDGKLTFYDSNGTNISAKELSSGEQMVLSMVAWLFYVQGLNSECTAMSVRKVKNCLKVILIDEPDSHLDPKLCKLFYTIIYDEFVSRYDIQVIMTSHRLDTVILAPPNSMFMIENNEDGLEIKNVHKLRALFRMSSNLRELVDYHHRVYVESINDALFYENVYHKLQEFCQKIRDQALARKFFWDIKGIGSRRVLSKRYQLSFYSVSEKRNYTENSKGNGGCDKVKQAVIRDQTAYENLAGGPKYADLPSQFFTCWLRTRHLFTDPKLYRSYGILDNDYDKDYQLSTHRLEDNIVVLKQRHSLENYLLDPIVFCSIFTGEEIKNFIQKSNLVVREKKGEEGEKLSNACVLIKRYLECIIQNTHEFEYSLLQQSLNTFFTIVLTMVVTNKYKYKKESLFKSPEEKKIYNSLKCCLDKNKSLVFNDWRDIVFIYSEDKSFTIKYPVAFLTVRGHDIEELFFNKNKNPIVDSMIKKICLTELLYIPADLAEIFFELNEKVRANVRSVIKSERISESAIPVIPTISPPEPTADLEFSQTFSNNLASAATSEAFSAGIAALSFVNTLINFDFQQNVFAILQCISQQPLCEQWQQRKNESLNEWSKRLIAASQSNTNSELIFNLKTCADSVAESKDMKDLRDALRWELLIQLICEVMRQKLPADIMFNVGTYQSVRDMLDDFSSLYRGKDYLYQCSIGTASFHTDSDEEYYNKVMMALNKGFVVDDRQLKFDRKNEQFIKEVAEIENFIGKKYDQDAQIRTDHSALDRLSWVMLIKSIEPRARVDKYKLLTDGDIEQFLSLLFDSSWLEINSDNNRWVYRLPNSEIAVFKPIEQKRSERLSFRDLSNKKFYIPENWVDNNHWVLRVIGEVVTVINPPGNEGWGCGYLMLQALVKELQPVSVIENFAENKQQLIREIIAAADLIKLRNIIVRFLLTGGGVDQQRWPEFLRDVGPSPLLDASSFESQDKGTPSIRANLASITRQGLKFGEKLDSDMSITSLKEIMRNMLGGYVFGKAKTRGDCFYDSFAQALEVFQPGKSPNFKGLRQICSNFTKQQPLPIWIQTIKDPDVGYDSFTEYQQKVQYTVEEAGQGMCLDKLAIWGTPEVDGRILCKHFGKILHIIELHTEEVGDKILVKHQIIRLDGEIELKDDDSKINYSDPNILHLVCARRHYVPLLPVQYLLAQLSQTVQDEVQQASQKPGTSIKPWGFDQLLTTIEKARSDLFIKFGTEDHSEFKKVDAVLNILKDLPKDIKVEVSLSAPDCAAQVHCPPDSSAALVASSRARLTAVVVPHDSPQSEAPQATLR